MTRLALVLGASLLFARAVAAQQQLGTKIMGGLGLDAGTQAPPGFYVVDRFIQFTSSKVRDRNGDALPIAGLDMLARANAIGLAYTAAPGKTLRLSSAVSVPIARASVNSDEPLIAIDEFGLGDMLVEPIKVGWTHSRYDVVTSYSIFTPTGLYSPARPVSVGRGHYTHMLSLGGALFSDALRSRRASALMSFEMNGPKDRVDIRRGNLLRIQGGAGMTVKRIVTAGIAGYALWQVSDDRGAALPPALAGVRTRTFGLGPEIDVLLPKQRMRAEFRAEWDFATRARPQGMVIAGGLSWRAWAPSR